MPPIPHETELKLVLAPGEGAKVAATPPLAGAEGTRARYSAIYFDTPNPLSVGQFGPLELFTEGKPLIAPYLFGTRNLFG